MSEPVVFDSTRLASLNDQHWRRLGITQTFDRLLVVAAATGPGAHAHVRTAVGGTLAPGAARFWEMSFPQILKDLRRRGILREDAQQVGLDPAFSARLHDVISQEVTGQSRVEPTPGVTLEDVLRGQEERAEREKAAKAAEKRRAARPAKSAPAKSEPRRRQSAPAQATASAPEEPLRTPVDQIFTSKRLNRLLDSLDTAALDLERLTRRVELSPRDMKRFVQVTDAEGITRLAGDLVELHWQGRELARTSSDVRRKVLIELVKKLRDRAEELNI